MNIRDLSTLLRSSKGYLSFNTSTRQMEVKGSHFLGKFAVWIRYKTSSSYRHSVAQAAQQLLQTMERDHGYSAHFNERRSRGTPEFFQGKKPISARQVYRFILDIENAVGVSRASNPQIDGAAAAAAQKDAIVEKWVSKLVGKDATEDSRKEFNSRLDRMLEAKIKNEPGLHKRNIHTGGIADEVYKAALDKATEINNKTDAGELIDTLLSSSLNKYIAHARTQLQERLQEHLSELDLPSSIRNEIETEIADMKIADQSQLDQRVIALFLAKIDDSFDDLLKEAANKYHFEKDMLAKPEIKEQLLQNLNSRLSKYAKDDKLSMPLVHSEAVKQLNQQRLDLVHTWVRRWSGCSEGQGREFFKDELHKSLAAAGVKGLSARSAGDEVAKEILEDPAYVAAIESEDDAKAIVLDKLQALLKPRIEQAHLEFRRKLHERLRQAELPDAEHRHIDNEISEARIKTMEQLNLKIKELVVKRIDSEFEDLFAHVKKGYGFKEEGISLTTVRTQLHEKVAALDAHRMVSVGTVRGLAVELLEQWLSVKMDALKAVKSNRLSEALLKKLVLQEPYVTKSQVEEFQQAIEQTRDTAYEKYTNSYEAQAIKPEELFSKFEQAEHREALYDRLSTLVQGAEKPDSVFDNKVWHASGIDAAMREHITDVVGPTIDSYRRVEHLSGLVPNFIYKEANKAVTEQGKTWGEDFVSSINGLYINTLKDDNNTALYELLESPEIGLQNIGTKSDNTPFTFKDLIESGIKKDVSTDNAKARHKAIDRLLPTEKKDYLLKSIEQSLSQTRDKVMSKTGAGKLFTDSVLGALRNASIDFDSKEINFKLQTPPPPHYETAV